jgi:predicted ArsR family transcriptional regulator
MVFLSSRGHVNTIRFHLDALTASGHVERVSAASVGPGRPPLAFQARRGMDPEGPRNYRLLAGILVESLAGTSDPGGTAAEAGRAWGSKLDADSPAATGSPGGSPSATRRAKFTPGEPLSTDPLSDDEAIGRLVGLMDDLGFAAEARTVGGERQIGLRHCPFLDLVQDRAQVICSMHLGLMQGAMGMMDTSVTVQRLVPFAEPDLCLVHLITA